MPITQLQDQNGIGSLIGMVGGYLAQNPARKAKQAQQDIQNKRVSATDARADAAAKDTHDNITSEIAARNATSTKNASDETNKQFQQGAYSKLLTQLHTPPPAGATPQQWVAHIQSQVPTLGLTDPKMLGDLYAEAQGVLTKAQTDDASKFVQGEMTLSGDPQKRLAQLTKRYNIERGKPGVDTKPTQQMIIDTQKQISDMEARAHQAAVEKRQSHHDQVTENQGERRLGIEQQNANRPRVNIRDANGLTPGEVLQEKHWTQTHNSDGTVKTAKKEKAPSIPQQRGADADAAGAAIKKPGADRDAIVKHYAAKWNISVDKADEELPE